MPEQCCISRFGKKFAACTGMLNAPEWQNTSMHDGACSKWVPCAPPPLCLSHCHGVTGFWVMQTACLCSRRHGACRDAQAAGVAKHIKWHDGPCSNWVPRTTPNTVVVNPPWGRRLLNDAEEEDEAEGDRRFAGAVHATVHDSCMYPCLPTCGVV